VGERSGTGSLKPPERREALSRQKERKGRFQTDSGIEVKALYTPLDLEEIGFDYARDLGFPGRYPFTRGVNPLGYRQDLLLIDQYTGFADAEEANKRLHFLLNQGLNRFTIAHDFPTQLGYDSSHPLAHGEVGKVGTAIDSLEDVEALFKGIPLDKLTAITTVCDAVGPIWIALLIALAEKQGVPLEKCTFRVCNNPLYEYYARGLYIFPPEASVHLSTDLIAYCASRYPHWTPLLASHYSVREAGANAAQEIAFQMADTFAYIDDAIRKGVRPEQFVSGFIIHIALGMDFFEEIAKARALRRLWAKTLHERYGISDVNLLYSKFYFQTMGSSLTAQQPMNNIIRTTIESVAGMLSGSGSDSITTASFDEAICLPTEQALKLAVRTQQIIAEETGVNQTVDPLAGSYFIEYLTKKVETMASEYLREVEEMGGAIRAIEDGYYQREIAKSAYETKRQIEKGEQVVVGVNKYVEEEKDLPIEILRVDPAIETKQVEKLKTLKRERNNSKVRETIIRVREAAENRENIVPPLIQAAKTYATIGEMCDALREVYGEYTPRGYF